MTFYPKEGLITLHQSINPPINEAITIELNKEGFGEFITETELETRLSELNISNNLTDEEKAKVEELMNYNIASTTGDTNNVWPLIPVIKSDGTMEISRNLDFHYSSNGGYDYLARISLTNTDFLTFNGVFSITQVYTEQIYELNDIFTGTAGSLKIRGGGNDIALFKNDKTTEFYGTVKTPNIENIELAIQTLQNIPEQLTEAEVNKVKELLPYSIGPNGAQANTWPNILTIGSDGVTEIGTYLDFHMHQHEPFQTNYDFHVRLSAGFSSYNNVVNDIALITSAPFLNDLIKTYALKIKDYGGSLSILNNADNIYQNGTPIVTFNNNKVTQFFGEISTPTLNTNGLNQIITDNTTNITKAIDYDKNKATGIVKLPTWTDNGNGSLTVNGDGIFIYSDNAAGDGNFIRLTATNQATLTPTDQQTNYFYSFYNGGSPVYGFTLNPATFLADARFVPAARIIRDGNDLYTVDYSNYGVSGTNKTIIKDVFLNGVQRVTGLILSTTATRIVTVSGGYVYFGVNFKPLPENISGTSGTLKEYYLIAGVWNNTTVLAYDSTYYSDGANRLAAESNKSVSKYFWRSISDKNTVYYIHGNQYTDINACIAEPVPIAPTFITTSAIYVGKIVIITTATNGTAYPVVWSGNINTAGATNHNDLSAIQGGTIAQYYHLNASEYAKVQTLNTYNIGTLNPTVGATWPFIPIVEPNVGVMEIGKYLDFHNVSNDGIDYYARLYANTSNSLVLGNGTFNAAIVSITGAYRGTGFKHATTGADTSFKNAADQLQLTLKNDLSAVFNGEISTPTWSSSGGSNTITHVTESDYIDNLEEGVFVETSGDIHYEPDFNNTYQKEITAPVYDMDNEIVTEGVYETISEIIPKNPYENCICKIRRANTLNKNIVGVLTSINPIKFATHGDVLIKVVMDTYTVGDIIIPTTDGYGKKASGGEIYDAMFMMIPRAKITSLQTKISNTVSAILL